jgi:transposase
MAYRELGMWEVLDVLRRAHRGETRAGIERVTGRTRKTIRRYLRTAARLGWEPGQGREPDEALAAQVAGRLRPGPPAAAEGSGVEGLLAPHREQLRAWLRPEGGGRGLRLSKVHTLLGRHGIAVPYSSLHRYVTEHCGFQDARRLTVRRAECAPGELAEVDFGRLGLVWDPEAQRRRVAHALLVTLIHSRHQYLHVTFSQAIPDLVQGLEEAWEFFGGTTARVVIDNLKAAVTKADRYDPAFSRTFAEYAEWRGFVIDAALPRHATGKPHVERNVQYVRESFFRGEHFLDLAHVQREAVRWCAQIAGQRIHGTTRRRPLVVFEETEKPALRSLERPRFDPPAWAKCKVHADHHVQFRKALYSVPTRHVGKTVWVRGDTKLVRIYVDGECVKTHERQPPGGRSTDYKDYPPERAAYAMRDPEAVIREAHRQGEHVGRFTEQLLAGPFPWSKLRQAQKLLRLVNKYGRARVDAACRRALYFELINVRRVASILEGDLAHTSDAEPARGGQLLLLPTARFLRPANHFTHTERRTTDGDQPVTQDRHETPQARGPAPDAPRAGGLREEGEAD